METVVESLNYREQYEIERGKPIPIAIGTSKNHSIIQSKLIKIFYAKYLDEFEVLSELSLNINDKDKIPDLSIYDELSYTPGADEIRVTKMPLGVIEILSPKQHIGDLIIKSNEYFDAGIKSYWLVLPDLKTIYVFSDKNEYEVYAKKDILTDTKLKIELDLGQIFQEKKE